ncbi:MAG: DUF2252 domain-containing protein, partial [Deltaproteobacteria bacterium]
MLRSLTALLLLTSVAAACDTPDDARASWLQSTLVADNLPFALRSPDLVAGKFAKMAASRYAYVRGTAAQFARDLAEPGGVAHYGTRHASGPAARVLLVGDPHPENLGTFRLGDGRLVIDFNDFDAARYGPFHHDVWRLAVTFRLACEEAFPGAGDGCDDVAEAAAEGYVRTIRARAAGLPSVLRAAEPATLGVLAEDLLRRAARDGDAREDLAALTDAAADAPALVRGVLEASDVPGVIDTELVSLDAEETALVDAILRRYPESLLAPPPPGELRVKDAVRRLGAGVASYPLWRFYVLVEGPTDAPEDDVVLEIKEVWDPLRLGALRTVPPTPFSDNGARVVVAQRLLQGPVALDPRLGWASLGQHAFRVRDRTPYQKGFSMGRLAKLVDREDADRADLVDLARLAGEVLADDHARAPLLDGGVAAPAIAAALGDDPVAFAA